MPVLDIYHCGTCNIELQGLDNVRLHCSTSKHIKSKTTQMGFAQRQIDGITKIEQQKRTLFDMLKGNSKVSVDRNLSVSDDEFSNENVQLSSVVFSNSQQSVGSVDELYMTTFNIEKLPHKYLIDQKVMVSIKGWNCILGVGEVNFCALCKTDVPNRTLHVENEKHMVFMQEKNKKLLIQFNYDIVSELPTPNTYHCAICNIVVKGSFYIANHCKETEHLANKEKSLKLVQRHLRRQTRKLKKNAPLVGISQSYFNENDTKDVTETKKILVKDSSYVNCIEEKDKDTLSPSIVQAQTNNNFCGSIENKKDAIDITEINKMLTIDMPFIYCVQERLFENLPINKMHENNTVEVPIFNLTIKPFDIFCHGPLYKNSIAIEKSDLLEYEIYASPINVGNLSKTFKQLSICKEIATSSTDAEQICDEIIVREENYKYIQSDNEVEDTKEYAIDSDCCGVKNHNKEIDSAFTKVDNCEGIESACSTSTEILKESDSKAETFLNVSVKRQSGFIINNEVHLPIRNWNSIIGTKGRLHCELCNIFFIKNRMYFHVNEEEHQLRLKFKEKNILAEFGYSIVSESSNPGTYHCAVCNITADSLLLMDIHCNNNAHRAQLEESRKRCANIRGNKLISSDQVPSTSNMSIIATTSAADTLRVDAKQNPPVTNNIKAKDSPRTKNNFKSKDLQTFNRIVTNNIKTKDLPLKITSVHYVIGKGVLINNKVTATSEGWHGCYNTRRLLHCTVCGVVLRIHEFREHSMERSHLDSVKTYPFLEEYGTDLIKKIRNDRYYCGICVCIIKPYQFENHVFSENHILNYNLAVKTANYIRRNMAKLKIRAMDF